MEAWRKEGFQGWNICINAWSIDEEIVKWSDLITADNGEIPVITRPVYPYNLFLSCMLRALGTAAQDKSRGEALIEFIDGQALSASSCTETLSGRNQTEQFFPLCEEEGVY